MSELRVCALLPTFDNGATIRAVVERVERHFPLVIVVDDGSGPRSASVLDALEAEGRIHLVRRERNGGKGAAVLDGLEVARALGYSHAFQIDADGQHDLDAIPRFLNVSRTRPDAAVFGVPEFDASAPSNRLRGHRYGIFWANVCTLGPVIGDPCVGFRVYPVAKTLALPVRGRRMDFDPELAVRLVWSGVPIRNEPVGVRYLERDEGGVSHFDLVWDTARIVLGYHLLVFEGLARLLGRAFGVGERWTAAGELPAQAPRGVPRRAELEP